MRYKPYIKITSATESFTFGLLLCAVFVGLFPFLLHMQAVDTFAEQAAGPCFAALTGKSDINDARNPERYSGYSIIIDTVRAEFTPNEDAVPKKEEKPQTMTINGKEYILK